MTTPTYHVDDLAELAQHIAKALEKMGIDDPPRDPDAEEGEEPQEIPMTISSVASRLIAIVKAMSNLAKLTSIHTDTLNRSQTTIAALFSQLEATTERLNQMEVRLRALQDATIEGTGGHHPIDHNPFVTNTESRYDGTQWADMTDLAATLALAPGVPGNALPSSSRNSSYSYRESRPFFKTHREEHVKRSRITYDGNGGQTPNIMPPAFTPEETFTTANVSPEPSDDSDIQSCDESVYSGEDSEEEAEYGGPAEPSLTSWLYEMATRALFRQ